MAIKQVAPFSGMTKDPGGGWSYVPVVPCTPDPVGINGNCLDGATPSAPMPKPQMS